MRTKLISCLCLAAIGAAVVWSTHDTDAGFAVGAAEARGVIGGTCYVYGDNIVTTCCNGVNTKIFEIVESANGYTEGNGVVCGEGVTCTYTPLSSTPCGSG